ncbi:MAG: right-handed parallel beta-helix repeat-containing protein [Thermodesulfobacteriota bacterium]
MNGIIWVAAVMAVVCRAFPAAADFYVIAGGGKAGTQITSVPYTITSPGLYCLSRNLTYSNSTGYAITVTVSGVTLDLMGFSLSGNGKNSYTTTGIFVNAELEGVEIRNGTVTSFGGYGIFTQGCKGVRLIGLRVQDNGGMGVRIQGSNHLAMGCSFLDNGGIGATIGQSLIKGNQAYGNTGGLHISSGSVISGNVCLNNSAIGISTGTGCSVLDNSVMGSGSYGINVSDGCTVKGNTCRGNTGGGINTGNDCLIAHNCTQGLTVGSSCHAVENHTY